MDKEQEDFSIESLPTDYADALENDKKNNKKQLKEIAEDPKANYDRAMSDYKESLERSEEQNKEEMKEISRDYTFDRDKTLAEYADFLKKDEKQNKEEEKEVVDDYKNNYDQAMKEKENYRKEDNDNDELISDHRTGFIRKDEEIDTIEKTSPEIPEKTVTEEKKEDNVESPQAKDEKTGEVQLEKETKEESKEEKETAISEKIKESVDKLISLSNRRDSLLAQEERQKELAKKMGIKGENDSQVEKELEGVDKEYQEALEVVKVLTGKSEEEIMEEYLGKKIEIVENTPEEKVEKINEKIDKIEEVLKEKEQTLSPEKKSLSEKIFERMGIKNKKAQLLIKAALVGAVIALPVAGVAVGGIYGLGLGQFILGQGFLPVAFGDMMGLGLATAGGGMLSKLLKDARALKPEVNSSEVPNKQTEFDNPERAKDEIIPGRPLPQNEEPTVAPKKEEVIVDRPKVDSNFSWVEPTAPDNKGTIDSKDTGIDWVGEDSEDNRKSLKQEELNKVSNFDELYSKINEAGGMVESDGKSISLEEIKNNVDYLRNTYPTTSSSDNIIPLTAGLRGIVRRLIAEEEKKKNNQ